jgi:hypothetical protein
LLQHIGTNAAGLRSVISSMVAQNFFVSGLVSISALQNGGMCFPNSNLFTANAFSAIDLGHMTFAQLATLKLFPVRSLNANMLLIYNYINTYGQTNLLTSLGIQATIFGHIAPLQLQPLNLYPLKTLQLTLDVLVQAGYITNDNILTALGISALHIRYLSLKALSDLGCTNDHSSVTLPQLEAAKYIYGTSKTLTSVGMAALSVGYFTIENYQNLGIFPYSGISLGIDNQTLVDELVHVGYFRENNLITSTGYYAYINRYFHMRHLNALKLWPCPIKPCLKDFVAAGYVSYSGQLTTLGNSLVNSQYIPIECLSKLGIRFHDIFHVFHSALCYGGYFDPRYRAAHLRIRSSVGTDLDGNGLSVGF